MGMHMTKTHGKPWATELNAIPQNFDNCSGFLQHCESALCLSSHRPRLSV